MANLRTPWIRRASAQSAFWAATVALAAGLVVLGDFEFENFKGSGPRFMRFFTRMAPPDWSVTHLVLRSTAETLTIAFVGTLLALLVSLPLGFLAASNMTPPWIAQPTKWLLGFIRSIPLIVVAMILVTAVGLGPLTGTLAIAFHSVGMLGKFYAEEFETADSGVIDAVRGGGANWLQTVRFGLLPQCVPQVLAFTIYRFEMNFRDAAVLGLVGAGGIGLYIQMYIGGFQYQKVAVLLIVIIVVVTALDQLSFWARRWVR